MKKTYTVTGGTGYIGSKLIESLSADSNNKVIGIIRPGSKIKVESENVEYVVFDGSEKSIENSIKDSDYLIHLAALYDTRNTEESTRNLIESNITFSTMLFNIADRVNQNIIISTASTFSSLDGAGNQSPSTLYAATKSAVEMIAKYYTRLSVHFLTFPDTHGPGDWRNKIHNILERNTSWPFKFNSSAEQQIRIMHIDDIIGHLLASLQLKEKGVHIHDIYEDAELLTLRELSELVTMGECLFNESAEIIKIPENARSISTKTGYKSKVKFTKRYSLVF